MKRNASFGPTATSRSRSVVFTRVFGDKSARACRDGASPNPDGGPFDFRHAASSDSMSNLHRQFRRLDNPFSFSKP